MENKILNDKAKEAFFLAKEKASSDNYGIDPLTLLTIIHVLLKLTELFLKWYLTEDRAAKAAKSINVIKKGIIWYYIRKEEKDKEQAKYILDSVCETLQNADESELKDMFSFHKKKGI
tara:strand:- start:4874 stop:5227 length:354 start_codon:yes stop_codon:yes gene_type:complete